MKKKTIFLVLGIVLLLAAAGFVVRIVMTTYAPAAVTEDYAPDLSEEAIPQAVSDEEVEQSQEAPYVSPVDFDSLTAINEDIYGWIYIPETNISYPVVQDPEDNSYYLTHNTDREYSANGSIFSEVTYNAKDFTTDPVVILYGHHMPSGDMFGNMQQYYMDEDFFSKDLPIVIYTEDVAYVYHVFAAVPYSNDHILYYNDFSDQAVFEEFFAGIMETRSLNAVFNEEYAPQYGDKVLILSTCLIGNNTQRFLVMATLQEN